MRNLTRGFTMRKGGALPRGDWFTFKKEATKTKIYIYDEIGFWGTSASDFVAQLKDVKGDIELHLNSPGGEVFDGIAIHSTLRQHRGNVTVYVDGLAASAASFIAQAGDKVVMARNAQMMIHDGIGFAVGNEATMLEMASTLSMISNNIADIYAESAKRRGGDSTIEDFRALMREEVWYNGKEAVEAGLADEVLEEDDEAGENVENNWDLSLFNHAGRKNAESPQRVRARLRLTNHTDKENVVAEKKDDKKDDKKDESQSAPPPPPADDSNKGTEGEQPNVGADAEPPVGADEPPSEGGDYDADPTQSVSPRVRKGGEGVSDLAGGVLINGVMVTDAAAIQQHIAMLENSQRESQATFRKNAIEALARDNKIPASQVDSLVNLVNGDGNGVPAMSNEQYTAFMASYESLPAMSLFDNHATRTEGSLHGAPGSNAEMSAEQKADRISTLQGIVDMNRRTMTPEDLKNTKSYVELQSLLGNNES